MLPRCCHRCCLEAPLRFFGGRSFAAASPLSEVPVLPTNRPENPQRSSHRVVHVTKLRHVHLLPHLFEHFHVHAELPPEENDLEVAAVVLGDVHLGIRM